MPARHFTQDDALRLRPPRRVQRVAQILGRPFPLTADAVGVEIVGLVDGYTFLRRRLATLWKVGPLRDRDRVGNERPSVAEQLHVRFSSFVSCVDYRLIRSRCRRPAAICLSSVRSSRQIAQTAAGRPLIAPKPTAFRRSHRAQVAYPNAMSVVSWSSICDRA